MKYPPFTYRAPGTVEELLRIVAERGDASETAILAGGQSLMPRMALRHASPSCLVDINGLAAELGAVNANADGLRLGALVRQRAAERDAVVRQRAPLLAEALPLCAKPAIRSRGTIGGSLAFADPAAEIPVVAVALDATVTATGLNGDRTIPAGQFFTGTNQTALAKDEVLTEVLFSELAETTGSSFMEISPRHADRAVVCVAAAVTLDAGTVSEVRVALGGVASAPVRAARTEAVLTGQTPDADAVQAAAALAAEDISPPSDLRASAAYRRHVTGVLVRRALTTAIERAGGVA